MKKETEYEIRPLSDAETQGVIKRSSDFANEAVMELSLSRYNFLSNIAIVSSAIFAILIRLDDAYSRNFYSCILFRSSLVSLASCILSCGIALFADTNTHSRTLRKRTEQIRQPGLDMGRCRDCQGSATLFEKNPVKHKRVFSISLNVSFLSFFISIILLVAYAFIK